MIKILYAFLLMLLLSCGSNDGGVSTTVIDALYLPDRTITDLQDINSTLIEWRYERIADWEAQNGRKAPNVNIITIDNWGFQCVDSPTGWCAGLYLSDGRIYAPIYSRKDFLYLPGPNELVGCAAHTLISSEEIHNRTGNDVWKTGKWYVGYIDGIGYPVIGHELDHAVGKKVE